MVQVGDLGYWPRHPQGASFLERIVSAAGETGVEVWFCDGNHEDHTQLPHDTATDPLEVMPRLWWVPRGTVVDLGGRRILFLGGAVSIDQERRTPEVTWFSQEIPSEEHWQRARAAGSVDVVIAHDTVPGMPVSGVPTLLIPWSIRRRARDHRRHLEEIHRILRPRVWVHGHWHQRATAQLDGTRFESLGHDRGAFTDSAVILDLADLSVHRIDA